MGYCAHEILQSPGATLPMDKSGLLTRLPNLAASRASEPANGSNPAPVLASSPTIISIVADRVPEPGFMEGRDAGTLAAWVRV